MIIHVESLLLSVSCKNAVVVLSYPFRTDSLYLTISLADVKDHSIDVTGDKLTFAGKSNGKDYSLNLEFVSMRKPTHFSSTLFLYVRICCNKPHPISSLLSNNPPPTVQGNRNGGICLERTTRIHPNEA